MAIRLSGIRKSDYSGVTDFLRAKVSTTQTGTYAVTTTAPDIAYTTLEWDADELTTVKWDNAQAGLWYRLYWVDDANNEVFESEPIYSGIIGIYTPKDVFIDSLDELAEDLSDRQLNGSLQQASADVRVVHTATGLTSWEKKWLVLRALYHAYIILANKWITKIPLTKGDRRFQLDIPYKNFSGMLQQLQTAWENEIAEGVRLENGRYVQKDNTSLVASYDVLWEDLVSEVNGGSWSIWAYEGYLNVDEIEGWYRRP